MAPKNSSETIVEMPSPQYHRSTDTISVDNMSVDIVYSVVDVPPFPVSIMLSIQQFITVTCSIILMPFLITPAICMSNTDPGKAYIMATMYFVIGLTTLLQILFGIRLPVAQGMAPSFIIPIVNLMNLKQFRCPEMSNALVSHEEQITQSPDAVANTQIWEFKLREIQGCIAIAAAVQILLSVTGLINVIVHLVTPLVVIPTLSLIGLSFIPYVTTICAENWIISLCTTLLIILSGQHLQEVSLPFLYYTKSKGFHFKWFTWFKFFPMITSVVIMCVICHILTVYNVLPVGNPARTDANSEMLRNTMWFKFPYPGQWGVPTISVPGLIAMIYAVFVVIIESVGSYYTCARLTGVPTPPKPAINRGIFIEGFGSLLAGLLGTGSGCTSSSESIAGISITKVSTFIISTSATRRSFQLASIYMLVFGILTKLAAMIVSIPAPIVGGIMVVSFSMTAGIGLSLTRYVNFSSSRNIFILGFSIWIGLAMPEWVAANMGSIKTGSTVFNEVIYILFSTSMFVGGVSAFILDRTIPGSAVNEEGDQWIGNGKSSEADNINLRADLSMYDFAYGAKCSNRIKLFRYLPMCPTYGQK